MDVDKAKPNRTVTAASQATRGFLSMPPEVRIEIYRLLFHRQSMTIEEELFSPTTRDHLSAQFLRTCRQIHAEAVDILYGENVFGFLISNTFQTFLIRNTFQTFLYPRVLSPVFSRRHKNAKTVPPSALVHMRHFRIVVEFTLHYKVKPIRKAVQSLVTALQKVPVIDYLHIECKLFASDHEAMDWRDPNWKENPNYSPDNKGEEEVRRALKTWLGRLRNVKTVVVDGLPDEEAEIIRDRCRSSEPLEQTPLADMYETLETHVEAIMLCEKELAKALSACETDDMELFKKHRAALLRRMERRWEAMRDGVMARDPRPEVGGDALCGGTWF
ncbi:hypothetical protein CONLIGDRAFT_693897 [Coniochaeta ligniaria NRRL 30616]|uniref:F-box domain-containing protein n=1 Tax=Coniochaeta ligniaria NRRL 30616 TaxID=1408157 RepID=A0A1J7J092_9PEZI|nr:hypothetical protein CONLIGDRAFT_693897 [Coniochaeta ligniaria NRRL 30616]